MFYRRGAQDPIDKELPEWDQMIESWEKILDGEHLASAAHRQDPGSPGGYLIDLQFDADGARIMGRWGRKVLNQNEWLVAIRYEEIITFARVLQGNLFSGGRSQLTGSFTLAEAQKTANLLNAGAIPVDLSIEDLSRVNPTIGKQGLDQILFAGAVAFAVISAFLLIYYLFPGVVAFLSLIAYILFCYAIFKSMGVTFSLAAIAGFILSVGMAVDANILIFERLKEELRGGRSLLAAIDLGFKRALPAILDSNACTIITCIVLINIGTGPVRGFATTLMIGVIISLFTAITVTRSLLLFLTSTGIGRNQKWYAVSRGWFGERLEAGADVKPLRVVQRMGRYFLISGLVILPGLIFIGLGGLKPNVEFQYGVESGVRLAEGASTNPGELNAMLTTAGFTGANVKVTEAGGAAETGIAWITIPLEDNPEFKEEVESGEAIFTTRQEIVRAVGGDDTLLTDEDGNITGIAGEESFEQTSPTVREETIRGAIIGVVLSATLIVIYLAIRFGVALGGFRVGLRFGFSAIGALVHDVLVTIGLAAIAGYFLNWEVSQLTITAILTVIGFSVHDSIVIFDRVRENLRRPLKGETFDHLVNRSITQSFARSINTSAVVVATLAILVFIGSATPDLKHFNAAMLIGILSGTYSSLFNAAPILVLWERIVAKRKGPKATIMQDVRLRAPAGVSDEEEYEEEDEEEEPGAAPEKTEAGDGRFAPTRRKGKGQKKQPKKKRRR